MFVLLAVKFFISKITLAIGLAGFLAMHSSVAPFAGQILKAGSSSISVKQVDQVFQGLPVALKKADLRPQQKPDTKFSKNLSAQSYLVMDEKSENILLAQAEKEVRPIGSISKLMAAIVFLNSKPNWDKFVSFNSADRRQGSNYVYEGEKASLRDFFNAALVGSSNSAVMTLVRESGLGSTEFIKQMNKEAEKLGLLHTKFDEPTGLSPENKSTAKEVAILLKNSLNISEIQEVVTKKSYEFLVTDTQGAKKKRKVNSTDQLLFADLDNGQIKAITGGKTGFIEEAGHCFAVEVENAQHNKIITVILGSDSEDQRFSEAKALSDWTFRSFVWQDAVKQEYLEHEVTIDK